MVLNLYIIHAQFSLKIGDEKYLFIFDKYRKYKKYRLLVTEIMFLSIQILNRYTQNILGVKSLVNFTFDGGSTAPKETDST